MESISLATCVSFCLRNVSLQEEMNKRQEVQSLVLAFFELRYPRATDQQFFQPAKQPTD
jgi:hypothetical protein